MLDLRLRDRQRWQDERRLQALIQAFWKRIAEYVTGSDDIEASLSARDVATQMTPVRVTMTPTGKVAVRQEPLLRRTQWKTDLKDHQRADHGRLMSVSPVPFVILQDAPTTSGGFGAEAADNAVGSPIATSTPTKPPLAPKFYVGSINEPSVTTGQGAVLAGISAMSSINEPFVTAATASTLGFPKFSALRSGGVFGSRFPRAHRPHETPNRHELAPAFESPRRRDDSID